jgi:hypothetical protein
VLTKQQSADGGMTVETGLVGPAVFLDAWVVRELSRTSQATLSARFVAALRSARGSLLVSSALVTELETLKGDSRARASWRMRPNWTGAPPRPLLDTSLFSRQSGATC